MKMEEAIRDLGALRVEDGLGVARRKRRLEETKVVTIVPTGDVGDLRIEAKALRLNEPMGKWMDAIEDGMGVARGTAEFFMSDGAELHRDNTPVDMCLDFLKPDDANGNYVIRVVKSTSTTATGSPMQQKEALERHIEESEGSVPLNKAQKTILENEVKGARLYHVEHIDPKKRTPTRRGRAKAFLNRVEVLKIPAETKIDGEKTVEEKHRELEEGYDREQAMRAAAVAARALAPTPPQTSHPSSPAAAAPSSLEYLPQRQRSREEDLGNLHYPLAQLRASARSTRKRYLYSGCAVLEFKRDFIVSWINEIKETKASHATREDFKALDELVDVLDDDVDYERLNEEELAIAWSMYGRVSRVEEGRYSFVLRFPSVFQAGPTAGKMIDFKLSGIAQFADGDGVDDSPLVRCVKKSDGRTTRGFSDDQLDNFPKSLSPVQAGRFRNAATFRIP